MAKTVNKKPVSKSGIDHQPKDSMALGRRNFIFMAVAGVMIVVGFVLMLGPSSDVNHFEPDIFSTRRIVVGPLLSFLGFLLMAFAIICPPYKWNVDKIFSKKKKS